MPAPHRPGPQLRDDDLAVEQAAVSRVPHPAHGPDVVDTVALARLYGEPLFALPTDLYIPPDALEVFLEAFEGPLDLLLYLIRRQNFNILDIPMASVTRQYLAYVEQIRKTNLELASEYLLMAAMLIEIKSRMLLPPKKLFRVSCAASPLGDRVAERAALRQIGHVAFNSLAFTRQNRSTASANAGCASQCALLVLTGISARAILCKDRMPMATTALRKVYCLSQRKAVAMVY